MPGDEARANWADWIGRVAGQGSKQWFTNDIEREIRAAVNEALEAAAVKIETGTHDNCNCQYCWSSHKAAATVRARKVL